MEVTAVVYVANFRTEDSYGIFRDISIVESLHIRTMP